MNEWKMFIGPKWENIILSTKARGFFYGTGVKKVVVSNVRLSVQTIATCKHNPLHIICEFIVQ